MIGRFEAQINADERRWVWLKRGGIAATMRTGKNRAREYIWEKSAFREKRKMKKINWEKLCREIS